MGGLGGTGRLADDLWLLAHHERSGKPHLQARALGLGLAGGLLAELVLPGTIRVWRGLVIPAGGQPPGDDLTHSVLRMMSAEREHLPVRDWLAFLAGTAGGRWRAGWSTPVTSPVHAAGSSAAVSGGFRLTRMVRSRRWCG